MQSTVVGRPSTDSDDTLPSPDGAGSIILSFDVEEHYQIEAAAGLAIDPALKSRYAGRVGPSTRWLLDQLDRHGHKATFFIVGQIAVNDPGLVRNISRSGHEVGSHGWDHRRLLSMTREEFREDLHRSCDTLQQATGEAIFGYRAPTFSVMRSTAWALDILAERGMLYDSSIYPVHHDRYGVPGAPRGPFLARGLERTIMEIPPATLQIGRARIPAGGGGYFRLLPTAIMERALQQTWRQCTPPVAMLYFHPWEFDPGQPRLPLGWLDRFRTYTGIGRSKERLTRLLTRHRFSRAVDVARQIDASGLPEVTIATC